MKSRQLYGDIRVIKHYSEKYSESTSMKFSNNIWEVRINYQWKVLRWIISKMITM